MRNIHTPDLTDAAIQSFLSNQYGQSIKPSARDFERAIFTQPNIVQCCKENHEKQTVEHVLAMKKKYGRLDKAWMGIWDALEIMDGLFDMSDPDVKTSQAIHAFQTAEAVRRDGQPRWLILTALIHDLGKLLYFLGEPQWTVSATHHPLYTVPSTHLVLTKRSAVILTPWVASFPARSCTTNFFATILISMTLFTRRNTASIHLNAVSTMCI